jgi:hypothetical protein
MEPAVYSETLIDFYKTARRQSSEDVSYEGCSESNDRLFFSRKLFIQNVWNSRTV